LQVQVGSFNRHHIVNSHHTRAWQAARHRVMWTVEDIDVRERCVALGPDQWPRRSRSRPNCHCRGIRSMRERPRGEWMRPEEKMIGTSQVRQPVYQSVHISTNATRFFSDVSRVDGDPQRVRGARWRGPIHYAVRRRLLPSLVVVKAFNRIIGVYRLERTEAA
jgi:hypothetical protein